MASRGWEQSASEASLGLESVGSRPTIARRAATPGTPRQAPAHPRHPVAGRQRRSGHRGEGRPRNATRSSRPTPHSDRQNRRPGAAPASGGVRGPRPARRATRPAGRRAPARGLPPGPGVPGERTARRWRAPAAARPAGPRWRRPRRPRAWPTIGQPARAGAVALSPAARLTTAAVLEATSAPRPNADGPRRPGPTPWLLRVVSTRGQPRRVPPGEQHGRPTVVMTLLQPGPNPVAHRMGGGGGGLVANPPSSFHQSPNQVDVLAVAERLVEAAEVGESGGPDEESRGRDVGDHAAGPDRSFPAPEIERRAAAFVSSQAVRTGYATETIASTDARSSRRRSGGRQPLPTGRRNGRGGWRASPAPARSRRRRRRPDPSAPRSNPCSAPRPVPLARGAE